MGKGANGGQCPSRLPRTRKSTYWKYVRRASEVWHPCINRRPEPTGGERLLSVYGRNGEPDRNRTARPLNRRAVIVREQGGREVRTREGVDSVAQGRRHAQAVGRQSCR